jgi:hypothetical protein
MGTKMKWIAWSAIGVLLAGPAAAQNAYLCITDVSAGMVFDRDVGNWREATFKTGKKYVFRKTPAEDPKTEGRWALFRFSQTSPWLVCPAYVSPNEDRKVICQTSFDKFLFNKQSLRFQYYYDGSYVDPSGADDTDTPFINIGTCSPL